MAKTDDVMSPVDLAIAAEVRASIARKGLSQKAIYERFGWKQAYFNRRYQGRVPWSSSDLLRVMNIVDEDITRVYAAGAAALEQEQHKTNLCLSHSDLVVSERGFWARRGYELATALGLYGTRRAAIDNLVKTA